MGFHTTFNVLEETSMNFSAQIMPHFGGHGDSSPWYAVFTTPKHEKRVSWYCGQKQIEAFLPLYSTSHRWKNRRTVELQLPLFPCYFFVRISTQDRIRILEIPGVISIISAAGQPLPVSAEYIRSLREGLQLHRIQPHANVEVGDAVRIRSGPFSGAQGILDRQKNSLRVVLKLEMLMRSVSLEVDAEEIEAA